MGPKSTASFQSKAGVKAPRDSYPQRLYLRQANDNLVEVSLDVESHVPSDWTKRFQSVNHIVTVQWAGQSKSGRPCNVKVEFNVVVPNDEESATGKVYVCATPPGRSQKLARLDLDKGPHPEGIDARVRAALAVMCERWQKEMRSSESEWKDSFVLTTLADNINEAFDEIVVD